MGYDINNINKYADDLLAKIDACIVERIKNTPQLVSAIVSKVNEDGTVNVYFPPNEKSVFTKIQNQSVYDLQVGDSVEIVLKDGTYSNCWILAKHGVNQAKRVSEGSGGSTNTIIISGGGSSGEGGGGIPTGAVRYDTSQNLTAAQQSQARANIGAGTGDGDYNNLINKPTIPTTVSQLTDSAEYAKINSPAFTGTPTTPNVDLGSNDTTIANTKFVQDLVANVSGGSVSGPKSAEDNNVVVFNGTTGKILKDSGKTLGVSVPADAKFTDTIYTHPTYESKANGLYKITVDETGHVSKTVAVTQDDIATLAFKPAGNSYLTFSSPSSFTLAVNDATKHWDGTLEYFDSDKVWTTWDGTTTLSSVDNDGEHVLYLRGTENTVITGNKSNYKWVLTGSDVVCSGNIENLLDYVTVESGAHPTMANYCYAYMFYGCSGLTQAPSLPATALANYCYDGMFYSCTSLTKAPALPATTLAEYCYREMFYGCTGLTQAPVLPATTLAKGCYDSMFRDCTSLTQAPALPATTLAEYCYSYMFFGCKSLTQTPTLPATRLAMHCYSHMFYGCKSLTRAPALPATTLAGYDYYNMFYGCTSLTKAPALPATTLERDCYRQMFSGCSGLTQAPTLPATTLANYCYDGMFKACTRLIQAPALPATTLAEGCYREMFRSCTRLKLSATQTDEYTQEYRIPSSGTGTTASYALENMFTSTGGTKTVNLKINTTYYLSSDNMIVYDTEVATLREYVGSIAAQKLKAISITLSATSWDSSAKTQTITVSGVLADETKQLITPTPAMESQIAYYNAGIRCTGQLADSLTFTAKTIPTANLTVYVTIQEVGA